MRASVYKMNNLVCNCQLVISIGVESTLCSSINLKQ